MPPRKHREEVEDCGIKSLHGDVTALQAGDDSKMPMPY